MTAFKYVLLPRDETGIHTVDVELDSCPLCGARYDSFRTRKVIMTAWSRGNQMYTAKVKCLNCGLNIQRCTEWPLGSLDESIRRVHSVWNDRYVKGGEK